jgi:hypothetical protein
MRFIKFLRFAAIVCMKKIEMPFIGVRLRRRYFQTVFITVGALCILCIPHFASSQSFTGVHQGQTSIAASAYTQPKVTISWDIPFPDATYQAVCTVKTDPATAAAVVTPLWIQIVAKTTTTATVELNVDTQLNPSVTLYCVGIGKDYQGPLHSLQAVFSDDANPRPNNPQSVKWNTPFPDDKYVAACTPSVSSKPNANHDYAPFLSKTADAMTVTLDNGAYGGTVDCIGVEPRSSGISTGTFILPANLPPPSRKTANITWDISLDNSSYTAVCGVGNGPPNYKMKMVPVLNALSPTYITFSLNVSDSGGQGEVDCFAIAPTAQAVVSPARLTFASQIVGATSQPQTISLGNPGNAPLIVSAITAGADFQQTNNCSTVAPSANCTISVVFKPTVTGTLSETLSISDNAVNSPQIVTLSGTGTVIVIATISLTSSPNPSVVNQAVTFTATINPAPKSPVGNISFFDGPTLLGTATPNGSGVATFQTASLASGSHNITASYQLSGNPSPTVSVILQQVVTAGAPDFTIAATPLGATITRGQSATFTVTVTQANGFNTPVTFSCGTLPAEASCTFAPPSVTPSTTPGSGPVTSILTITTTAPTVSLNTQPQQPPSLGYSGKAAYGVCLAAVLLIYVPRRFRRRQTWLTLVAAGTFSAGLLAGCGAIKNLINQNTDPGTPTGTSTVTVTATAGTGSAARTHSATLNIAIQ